MSQFCISRKFVLLSFFVLMFFVGQAQKLNHVQGQILIQLENTIQVENWIQKFNRTHDYSIEINRKVSPVLDIYEVNFDFTAIDESKVLLDLTLDRNTIAAQFNHFVNLRSTIPNDSEFNNQWQYINTGQNGGKVGADIDIDLAWDFTTGGLTPDGDTIVVCIIDDGIDNTHPDITPNLFLNHAEIPNNGIDDDNNGFIDDYRGWRTSQGNDNVYSGGGHGTPVAGIVGAKGNDGQGVAGVNWNVKLMIVRGGTGVESEVIEAYSYPLTFRKKYNETNGAEGAFVVSTNASWGVDFGQPDDAPLWCSFYDTLGAAGILNCGATINGNQNVDIIGDLPTACPSDYLISVTNMNRFDEKVSGAGYGINTIDLGAFGAQTWTVTFGGGFGGFGGTSGATPHVTGTIGLLYALECSNLTSLAKTNPAAAAALVKKVILDGTDVNESLENITVTGGRLNVYNSALMLLEQFCTECPAPFESEITIENDVTASLTWIQSDTTTAINVRWRKIGEPDWIIEENITSPFTFPELELCAEYEYQLQAICENTQGEYLINKKFSSTGCCVKPELIEAIDVNDTGATITWKEVPAANSYNVRYRLKGEIDWIEFQTDVNSLILSDLASCSFYEVEIQSICVLSPPDYTETFEFFTLGCTMACTQLPYCDIFGYDASEEWIQYISINGQENESGSDSGYGAYFDANMQIELAQSGKYLIRVEPGFSNTTFNEYYRVWIDFDQNSIFDEETELVFFEEQTQNVVEGIISIPADVKLGNTRMRIAMQYDSNPNSCVDTGFDEYGEVEDYCVNIIEFTCPSIQEIEIVDITKNTVSFIWPEDLNIGELTVLYRVKNTVDWIETQADDSNNHFLSDLIECTDYELALRSECPDYPALESAIFEFTTECSSNTNSVENKNSFTVYPNPSNKDFIINTSKLTLGENIQIKITDKLGRNVLSLDAFNNGKSVNVSGESLLSGIYFLEISDKSTVLGTKKIIKLD